eukprot:gene12185-14259_t
MHVEVTRLWRGNARLLVSTKTLVLKKVIGYAIGSTFPSPHFTRVSAVSRAWWKAAFKSVRNLEYHFPYIYESSRDIRRCKLMSRWLSPTNHYALPNQISTANLGFGFDGTGFSMLYNHLLTCDTLRTLRILFYQRIVPIERIRAVCSLISENPNIRRLDLSQNICPTSAISLVASTLSSNTTCLRDLIWREASIDSDQFLVILQGVVQSQVSTLNLQGNSITDNRIDQVVRLISGPSKLTALDLSFNTLRAPALKQIIHAVRNTKIRRLNLQGNTVSDRELAELRCSAHMLKLTASTCSALSNNSTRSEVGLIINF